MQLVGALKHKKQRFDALAANVATAQTDQLWRILQKSDKSLLAQHYQLTGKLSADTLRRALPIMEYEALRPWINQVFNGNPKAMFNSATHVVGFGQTSGTTAEPKIIPFTRSSVAAYRHSWTMWGLSAFPQHPTLFHGSILGLPGEQSDKSAPCGLPITSMALLTESKQMRLVRQRYVLVAAVHKISDPSERLHAIARLSLARNDVAFVTTANPSTLINLAAWTEANAGQLIREIHDGSVPPALKSRWTTRANRSRAKDLDHLASLGQLKPNHYWPNLALVAVWLGGTVSWYLPELERWYAGIPKRDPGLIATEGRFTIPMQDASNGGVLDITNGFFEFLPRDSSQDTTLLAHELDVGCDYDIVVTNYSGLFRYRMHDIVRCIGKYKQAPVLAFLQKDAGFWNFTGEKIAANQVSEAFAAASRSMNLGTLRWAVAPVFASTPHYVLLTEQNQMSDVAAQTLLAHMEQSLQNSNVEYRDKRRSNRLAPMRHVAIAPEKWREWESFLQQRSNQSAEQIKHPVLISDVSWANRLTGK